MKPLLLTLLIATCLTACNNRNKLNTNEQKLAAQIKIEEQEKKEAEEQAKQNIPAIPDTLPPGFRFQEDRSVDPNNPPVVIDFSGEFDTINLKLSDIAQTVKYIRLQVPHDSMYFSRPARLNFTKDFLVVNNNYGIQKFTKEGEFIESICYNELGNNRIPDKSKKFGGFFSNEDFKGAWANHVSVANNQVLYKFTDYSKEKVELFTYKLNDKSVIFTGEEEVNTNMAFAKGEIVANGKVAIRSGTPGLASTNIQAISDDCYAGLSGGLSSYDSKTMMVTFNKNGDTLCVFSQQDTLDSPITSTVIKSIPTFTSCMYKGFYTFRRAFSDTIFRLVPPNRLVPVYVLKQGDKKISDEEWYHFKNKVGKLRPGNFFETDNFMLFEFRKYRAKGERTPDGFYVDYQSLRFYFDKKKEKLSLINITHRATNSPYVNGEGKFGFENDLDGGFGFWPQYVTPKGNLAKTIRPESLKSLVEDERFETRSANKQKLKELAQSLTNNNREIIVMIVE